MCGSIGSSDAVEMLGMRCTARNNSPEDQQRRQAVEGQRSPPHDGTPRAGPVCSPPALKPSDIGTIRDQAPTRLRIGATAPPAFDPRRTDRAAV